MTKQKNDSITDSVEVSGKYYWKDESGWTTEESAAFLKKISGIPIELINMQEVYRDIKKSLSDLDILDEIAKAVMPSGKLHSFSLAVNNLTNDEVESIICMIRERGVKIFTLSVSSQSHIKWIDIACRVLENNKDIKHFGLEHGIVGKMIH